uniref:Uncharacterized protein n=1 Tax=Thermorudis peleae TaxID=1382356 RepID=A0A831TFJ8_9BACT
MQWDEWYPLFSAITYFGSLALGIAVSILWVTRRHRHFRALDWAYELLVAWLFAAALWQGIRQGPVWDTALAGSPIWLRSLIALAVASGSVVAAWWVTKRSHQPERAEDQAAPRRA